jgi:hypothetical protein
VPGYLRGLTDELQGLTVGADADVQENKRAGGKVDEHEEEESVV